VPKAESRSVEAKADPIADLRSPSGSLISVYARRPTPGGFAALLSDLVRPLRERSQVMARSAALSIRADADRIHDLAGRFEVEAAPAYAVFASSDDGVFVIEPLAHEVPNVAMVGPRPYLRPLRSAPMPLRSGVLVADRVTARVFTATEDVVTEVGHPHRTEIGKPNFGGFGGYDEHTVRSRAAKATTQMWRQAGQVLLDEHQSRPFDYLALGTHDEMVEELARSLHPYLARLPRVSFPASPGGISVPALRAELRQHDVTVRRDRQAALAGRVCDEAWRGGNAVLGLTSALEAANLQAIDTLVVAGDFRRGGATCPQCSHLARSVGTCPVCGSRMLGIEDVIGALMEATIAAGGTVSQIDVPSPLDTEGIGALVRFPIGT
jgi:hypothetical protein